MATLDPSRPTNTGDFADPPEGYEPRPWDRLQRETPEAFLWFASYRDMPAMGYKRRSLRKLWEIMSPGRKDKMNSTLFNWSVKHQWKERAEAYDLEEGRAAVKVRKEMESDEQYRISQNQQVFKDNLVYLSQQAIQKSSEILKIPTVRRSFLELKDGKTIIHKPHLLSPGHLMAAAALAKMAMDLGRFALGLKDDDGATITPDQFRKLFYKNTGQAVRELPQGALPAPPDNPNSNPNVMPPSGDIVLSNSIGPDGVAPPPAVEKVKPPIERP